MAWPSKDIQDGRDAEMRSCLRGPWALGQVQRSWKVGGTSIAVSANWLTGHLAIRPIDNSLRRPRFWQHVLLDGHQEVGDDWNCWWQVDKWTLIKINMRNVLKYESPHVSVILGSCNRFKMLSSAPNEVLLARTNYLWKPLLEDIIF